MTDEMNGHKPHGWLLQWLQTYFSTPTKRDVEIEQIMERLREKRSSLSDSYDEVIREVRAAGGRK
jgi:hypothetical protein